ncbi:MAG: nitroreductase/quinone reductase family protein [Anaerolineae bacterium]|nr:nitroreductase/quinone reductase family protein [Anaerolineae bacterium]
MTIQPGDKNMAVPQSTVYMDPAQRHQIQSAFKALNRFMVLMWRLGLGRFINIAPRYAGQIMVLVHTGRKSGLKRRTPVNYAIVDGVVYCTAGFGPVSDWYRNLKVHPEIELWLPDSRWQALASEVMDPALRLTLVRQVLIGSGFAAYLAGINPHTMSDEALAQATADYPVLRLDRRSRLDESADLAWVWLPIAGIAGLVWLGCNSVRRRRV